MMRLLGLVGVGALMEIKKIILKLNEEQLSLIKQLEESPCPLLTEVIVHGLNKIKAIDYILPLLQQGKIDFKNEREYLIAQIKGFSPQTIPVDIIQTVHRLQIIFYIKKLLEMEE